MFGRNTASQTTTIVTAASDKNKKVAKKQAEAAADQLSTAELLAVQTQLLRETGRR
ncbi:MULTISPECIES: hypothetical protein [Streptomyces]|uniref:Uncharacterized protein n=1 Tax=Streptomyces clavifer TaxID=68188 RepID=A0ABS4V8K4_9ACTN|nr:MULTISPECIES: hypothetical protein [Streptomyces]MBP2360146.1 hypothetical protein [Streptomyces clavifer]MDX2743306.1 hypothetical protein [Streptomyces sp. NRRL_B-2557]GHA96992.1 hypothetical protein GCM10010392_24330 [Streptomyces clavifer]